MFLAVLKLADQETDEPEPVSKKLNSSKINTLKKKVVFISKLMKMQSNLRRERDSIFQLKQ